MITGVKMMLGRAQPRDVYTYGLAWLPAPLARAYLQTCLYGGHISQQLGSCSPLETAHILEFLLSFGRRAYLTSLGILLNIASARRSILDKARARKVPRSPMLGSVACLEAPVYARRSEAACSAFEKYQNSLHCGFGVHRGARQ